MRFDSSVIDFAVQHLGSLQNRLKNVHGLDNPRFDVENTLRMLQNIRSNQSLRKHYEEMLNQCNVLLVSYFSSAVADIFRTGVAEAVRTGSRPDILRQEISIELSEAREIGPELVDRAGELLLASHREINLQNMQSVAKAFADYFGYQRKQDEVVNDIILSHACRHVIVHNAAVADRKMIGLLRAANPRTVMPKVSEGDRIQFTETEVEVIAGRMKNYLGDLATGISG
jgi:hypothetical protein